MDDKLDKNKEIDLNSFLNKITEKHKELDIPKFCLFLGSGCSQNSGIPSSPELIKILQKIIYTSRYKDYFSMIKNSETNIYDYLDSISQFITKNSNDFKKFCRVTEERFRNNIELNKYITNIPTNLSDEYKKDSVESLKKEIINIIFNDIKYSKWFEEYSEDPRQRQQLIEELIENKDPGGSYIFLANIINEGFFNNIFTTNFDDLINDSLLKYVDLKSKVYAHNEIAKYISIYSKKPNIIKLHGDFLFQSIKNTQDETRDLEGNLKFKLTETLKCLNLIVVGYSGTDNSVMNTLKEIKKDTSFQLIWCITKEDFNNNTINWRVFDLINNYGNSFFILIDDFDTLFFNIWSKFGRPLKDLEAMVKKRNILIDELLKKFDDQNVKNSTTIPKKEKDNFKKFLDTKGYINSAYLLMQEKQFEKALEKLKKGIEIDPNDPNIYFGRSITYYNMNNPDKALEDINRAIKLNNIKKLKNPHYYSVRAKIYIMKHQIGNASKDLGTLFLISPKSRNNYNIKAMIYFEKKQYDIALESINTAIKIKGDEPSDYSLRSGIYQIKKQYDNALKDINIAIGLNDIHFNEELLIMRKIEILIIKNDYSFAYSELRKLKNIKISENLLAVKNLFEIILKVMLNHKTEILEIELKKIIQNETLKLNFDFDDLENWAKSIKDKTKKEIIINYISKIKKYNI